MPRLKRLTSREILRFFGRFGFEVVSMSGSHAKLVRTPTDRAKGILTGQKEILVTCSSVHATNGYRYRSRDLQAGKPIHP